MALRQNLNKLDLTFIDKWQNGIAHIAALRESSTLLEPAQFVFFIPNGKVVVSDNDDDDEDDDVNKYQLLHLSRQLSLKTQYNHLFVWTVPLVWECEMLSLCSTNTELRGVRMSSLCTLLWGQLR